MTFQVGFLSKTLLAYSACEGSNTRVNSAVIFQMSVVLEALEASIAEVLVLGRMGPQMFVHAEVA